MKDIYVSEPIRKEEINLLIEENGNEDTCVNVCCKEEPTRGYSYQLAENIFTHFARAKEVRFVGYEQRKEEYYSFKSQ